MPVITVPKIPQLLTIAEVDAADLVLDDGATAHRGLPGEWWVVDDVVEPTGRREPGGVLGGALAQTGGRPGS
jgi:hypothetical protein